MTFGPDELHALLQYLDRNPQERTRFLEALNLEAVAGLPLRFDRLAHLVEQIAEAQQRTDEHLAQLAVRMDQLVGEVSTVKDRLQGMWGQFEGDRYEQRIRNRALMLFSGGEGGAPGQPHVQQRLYPWIKALSADRLVLDADDPTLADLIWWKGDQVGVVEVSMIVDRSDVTRSLQRAETLRRAGAQAQAFVIGDAWSGPEARLEAQIRAVAWKVGDDLSEGFIDFRRLPNP